MAIKSGPQPLVERGRCGKNKRKLNHAAARVQ